MLKCVSGFLYGMSDEMFVQSFFIISDQGFNIDVLSGETDISTALGLG